MTTTFAQPTPQPQAPPAPPASGSNGRHTTRHYRLDIRRAEILAKHFDSFTVVMIRECLEGEPLKRAVALLGWAARKDPRNPYAPLRRWARKNKRGFYSAALRKQDPNEQYRNYMLYLRRKEKEQLERGGGSLTPSRIEELTNDFHAPGYRARMGSVSEAVWKSHEAG